MKYMYTYIIISKSTETTSKKVTNKYKTLSMSNKNANERG